MTSTASTGEEVLVVRHQAMVEQLAIVNSFSRVAFDNAVITEGGDGRTIFVEATGERLHRETGRVHRNIYVIEFELRDSLISCITEYSNPVGFAAHDQDHAVGRG